MNGYEVKLEQNEQNQHFLHSDGQFLHARPVIYTTNFKIDLITLSGYNDYFVQVKITQSHGQNNFNLLSFQTITLKGKITIVKVGCNNQV